MSKDTPTMIVNAPSGIVIGGGTVHNPTVNNFGPPQRKLTEQQIAALTAPSNQLPSKVSYILHANTPEAGRFANEIASLFQSAGKELDNTIVDLAPDTNKVGLGVLVNDVKDSSFALAQELANAIREINGVRIHFEPAKSVPPGKICIRIALNPAG